MPGKKGKKTDEEPLESAEPTESTVPAKGKYGSIRQYFSEEDLDDPKVARAIIRNVIGENDELRKEVANLRVFQIDYYVMKEAVAVLQTKLEALRSSVGVKTLMFGLGGIFGGLTFSESLANYSIGFGILAFLCFFIGMWDGKFYNPFEKKES